MPLLTASTPAREKIGRNQCDAGICDVVMGSLQPFIPPPVHSFGLGWKIVTYGPVSAELFADFLSFH
jgi:hypothetical protein